MDVYILFSRTISNYCLHVPLKQIRAFLNNRLTIPLKHVLMIEIFFCRIQPDDKKSFLIVNLKDSLFSLY